MINSIFRLLLKKYRELIYPLFGRRKNGIMNDIIKCQINGFIDSAHFDDVVHPSIRECKILNEKYSWWMVYTPYYGADSTLENPILAYAIDETKENWYVYKKIVEKPSKGYNSDPALFCESDTCTVFWREYETERTTSDNVSKAIYAKQYRRDGEVINVTFPVMKEIEVWEDRLVSPAFIKHNGRYYAYAMHLRFKNNFFQFKNRYLHNIVSKILTFTSLLYLYDQQKSYGISIWKTETLEKPFKYIKTRKIKNKCRLYTPWHLDVFEYNENLYAVIQTNQSNADIVLAVSHNFEDWEMFSQPLLTSHDLLKAQKIGLYKPTAFVDNKGLFNLYVSLQDVSDRSSNRLYKLVMPFEEVLANLNK